MNQIKGGYYLKAKCFQESWISKAPPHVREIWDLFLRKAMFKDAKELKRGQLLTTYGEIIEDLSWFVGYRKMSYKKHHCETAMKALKNATMITATKTTRGIVVTILNYDKYQNIKNYETYTKGDTKTTTNLQCAATIEKELKEVKEIKKELKDIGAKKTAPQTNKFDPTTFRPDFISEKSWSDLVSLRRAKRAAQTKRGYQAIVTEILKAIDVGFSADECIDKMCNRNWTGFEAKWMENDRDKQKGKNGFKTKQDINNEIQEIGAVINERTKFNPYRTIESGDSSGNVNQSRGALPE